MQANEKTIKLPLVRSVSKYIFFVLKSFGLYEEDDTPKEDAAGDSGANKEETITPYMNALSEFRDKIKARADEGPKVMFKESDDLRDNVLPSLGIRLGDRKAGEPAVWDFVDPAVLLKEKEAKLAEIAAKEEKKRVAAAVELKKKSTAGKDYFKLGMHLKPGQANTFNEEYDENGIPTLKAGKEIKDGERKKL